MRDKFSTMGIEVLEGETEEEIDEYDFEGLARQRRAKLLKLIPQMEQRQDATCEQLSDLILVADRLGMYDAVEALNLWLEATRKAQPPPSYYAPIG